MIVLFFVHVKGNTWSSQQCGSRNRRTRTSRRKETDLYRSRGSCGPEKAWPADTSFGHRAYFFGRRSRKKKCCLSGRFHCPAGAWDYTWICVSPDSVDFLQTSGRTRKGKCRAMWWVLADKVRSTKAWFDNGRVQSGQCFSFCGQKYSNFNISFTCSM